MIDNVWRALCLQAFSFGAPTFDSQPSVGRRGNQFVAGQVEHVVNDVYHIRRDSSRSQLRNVIRSSWVNRMVVSCASSRALRVPAASRWINVAG